MRFRWLVIAAWVAIAIASSVALPSLGSEVNNDNTQFLPNSAPSNEAATLAAPLIGSASKQSQIIIVAALVEQKPPAAAPRFLSAADLSVINAQAVAARSLPHVVSSEVVGISPDRQAARILVTTDVGLNNIVGQEPVVNTLQAKLGSANRGPVGTELGLQFHLAGPVATNVANQASSNKTGNKVQLLSLVFIVLLLLVIFRSVLAPLITLAPAGVALVVSMRLIGELGAHGLKVSEITELLLIVLMLGAGTDYGLFLVYRSREELRSGLPAKEAVAHALARVGESISASAATVVFALLSLLLASFGLYHDLGVPLAVGVAVMLVAGLTLLPALLAVFGNAAFWPSQAKSARSGDATGAGLDGEAAGESDGWWGRVAARLVSRPKRTLVLGVALFAALSVAALGYYSSGFAGALNAPAGSDEAIGNALFARHFPAASANPAELVFRYGETVWANPDARAAGRGRSRSLGPFPPVGRPARPRGSAGPAGHSQVAVPGLGAAGQAPAGRAGGAGRPPARRRLQRLPLAGGVRVCRRADSPVRRHPQSRQPGLHPGHARHSYRPPGCGCRGFGLWRPAERRRRGSGGPVRRQQHFGPRHDRDHPRRHRRHRLATGAGAAQPGGAAVPDPERRALLPGSSRLVHSAVHRHRRQRRDHVRPPVLDVHFPAGAGGGLQHPRDDAHPGGGAPAESCRRPS